MKIPVLLVILKVIFIRVNSQKFSTIQTSSQNENVNLAILSKNVTVYAQHKATVTELESITIISSSPSLATIIPSTIPISVVTTTTSITTASPSSFSTTSPISSSSSSDYWPHTKILAKKKVDWKNHADKSVQIASPPDGDFLTFIRDSSFWMDKSLLIRKLFEELWNYNAISTAPPKWGKTINLSMFKFYCELPLDSDGFEIPKNQSASHFYFNEGKILSKDGTFEELDGMPLINGYEEHFASYPIIHISGANISGNGVESLRTLLHETYKRHAGVLNQLLLKSARNNTEQIVSVTRDLCDFLSFYDLNQVSKLNSERLWLGIQTLTRILYNIYQKNVIILMDDYDNYAHSAFFDIEPSNFTAFEDQFATIWTMFVRFTFKHNQHLERALITGVLKARDPASLQKFQNNFNKYVFDDQDLFPYYGIFENEFRLMASKRGIDRKLRDEATRWYGGYRTLSHMNVEMYSPYSVIQFFSTLRIQNYWQSSRLSEFVRRFIRKKEFQQRIRSMIESFDNNTVHTSVIFPRNFKRIDWKEYVEIQRIERDEVKYDASNEELIFSLLISTGYAAIHEYQLHTGFIVIRIPNVEIRNQIYAAIEVR